MEGLANNVDTDQINSFVSIQNGSTLSEEQTKCVFWDKIQASNKYLQLMLLWRRKSSFSYHKQLS